MGRRLRKRRLLVLSDSEASSDAAELGPLLVKRKSTINVFRSTLPWEIKAMIVDQHALNETYIDASVRRLRWNPQGMALSQVDVDFFDIMSRHIWKVSRRTL